MEIAGLKPDVAIDDRKRVVDSRPRVGLSGALGIDAQQHRMAAASRHNMHAHASVKQQRLMRGPEIMEANKGPRERFKRRPIRKRYLLVFHKMAAQ